MILYKNTTKRHNSSFPFFPINIGEFRIEQLQSWIELKTRQRGFIGAGILADGNVLIRFDLWEDLSAFHQWQDVKEDYKNPLVRQAVFDWDHILSTLNYETLDSHSVESVDEVPSILIEHLVSPYTAANWASKFKMLK